MATLGLDDFRADTTIDELLDSLNSTDNLSLFSSEPEFSLSPPQPQRTLSPRSDLFLDGLESLSPGHVQKLIDSWELASQDLDSFGLEQKKEFHSPPPQRQQSIQPLIEFWEAKKKLILIPCSNAPGHAHTESCIETASQIYGRKLVKPEPQAISEPAAKKEVLPMLPDCMSYPVPLPQPLEVEPRYVNPKQYKRILKRRQQRTKFYQTHVVVKQQAPYKHLSRHEHAQRRQRGAGGRFMKKQKQQPTKQPTKQPTQTKKSKKSKKSSEYCGKNDLSTHGLDFLPPSMCYSGDFMFSRAIGA